MGYEIVAGRIVTWSLEIHPVDHCNLRCVQCCTMSPALPAAFADPEQIAADLALLAPVLRPNLVKLTGGEPLLHPRLVEILAAVRASGVSDQIQVTTNGHLLKRQPEAFWRAIDRLTVSWYSSRPLPEGFIAWVRAEADRYGVLLQVKPTSAFQRITPDAPLDEAGAHASFAGCWMKDRCHLVHQGRFYRCTRPPPPRPGPARGPRRRHALLRGRRGRARRSRSAPAARRRPPAGGAAAELSALPRESGGSGGARPGRVGSPHDPTS